MFGKRLCKENAKDSVINPGCNYEDRSLFSKKSALCCDAWWKVYTRDTSKSDAVSSLVLSSVVVVIVLVERKTDFDGEAHSANLRYL